MNCLTNFILNVQHYFDVVNSCLFNVKKIHAHNTYNGKKAKYNLYINYIIVKNCLYLKKMDYTIINVMTIPFLYFFNQKNNIVNLEIENNKYACRRNLIFTNKTIEDIINHIPSINYDVNELIMQNKPKIITDIQLNDKSIKHIIEKYSDKSQKYEHTLKNILDTELDMKNGIEYKNIDKLQITFFPKKHQVHNLGDFLNEHVTKIFN